MPMMVETFAKNLPLGRFAMWDIRQTVVVEVIKVVVMKEPIGVKVTKAATKKR